MSERPVVIVSNRGPLSFSRAGDGSLAAKRGAGGLVSGLAPLVVGTDALWLAAAMSDVDREAAHAGQAEAEGLRVRLLDIDAGQYRMFYDVVCNATLWFCLHGLFDLTRRPRIDRRWYEAWEAYRAVNRSFAEAVADAAPENAAVLVQDYHLALVGRLLAPLRPDVHAVHFSHTPFCEPTGLAPLPDGGREFIAGMTGHQSCGFHTARWANAFRRSAGDDARVFVSPLAPDADDLEAVAESEACAEARRDLAEAIGDRKVLLRVDRIEPSKNVLRGFHALDDLFTAYPEWRERVVFVALLYPSREGLPEYLAYRQEVEGVVRQLNEKWATPGWTPVLYDGDDDFPRSVAALQLADVVLVNPIRDGLNLVAKEQALLNGRDAVLILSTEAGAWDELADAGAIGINPFDVAATADALHDALSMPADERRRRHQSLRAAAQKRTPRDWLNDQLNAASAANSRQ